MLYAVQRGHIILTCTRHTCNVCVRTDDIIAHELLLKRIQSKYIVLAPVQRHDMATVSNSKMIFFVRSMIRKQQSHNVECWNLEQSSKVLEPTQQRVHWHARLFLHDNQNRNGKKNQKPTELRNSAEWFPSVGRRHSFKLSAWEWMGHVALALVDSANDLGASTAVSTFSNYHGV